MGPFDRQYDVELNWSEDTTDIFTFRAGSARASIAVEIFLDTLENREKIAEIAGEAVAMIEGRLVSWKRDGQAMNACLLLDKLETTQIIQVVYGMNFMQQLSYNEKKSCKSPSPSDTGNFAVPVADPVEATPAAPIYNAPSVVAPTSVAPSATTSAGGC